MSDDFLYSSMSFPQSIIIFVIRRLLKEKMFSSVSELLLTGERTKKKLELFCQETMCSSFGSDRLSKRRSSGELGRFSCSATARCSLASQMSLRATVRSFYIKNNKKNRGVFFVVFFFLGGKLWLSCKVFHFICISLQRSQK